MNLFVTWVDAVWYLSFAAEELIRIFREFTEGHVTIHSALLSHATASREN